MTVWITRFVHPSACLPSAGLVSEYALKYLRACAPSGGEEKLSAVVNTALAEHVERLGRLASLRHLLDRWEAEAGPVPAEVRADAAAAFDEAEDGPGMATG